MTPDCLIGNSRLVCGSRRQRAQSLAACGGSRERTCPLHNAFRVILAGKEDRRGSAPTGDPQLNMTRLPTSRESVVSRPLANGRGSIGPFSLRLRFALSELANSETAQSMRQQLDTVERRARIASERGDITCWGIPSLGSDAGGALTAHNGHYWQLT